MKPGNLQGKVLIPGCKLQIRDTLSYRREFFYINLEEL